MAQISGERRLAAAGSLLVAADMAAKGQAVAQDDSLGKDIEADRPPLADAAVAAQGDEIDQFGLCRDQPVAVDIAAQLQHADVVAGPAKPPETGLRDGDPIAFRRGKAGAADHGKASRLYIDILNRERHPVLQNKPHACAARFSRQFRPANRRNIDGGVGKIETEFNLEVAQRASRDQHDIAAQAAFHVEACCRRHEGGKPLGLGRVGAKHQPVLQTVFRDHEINRCAEQDRRSGQLGAAVGKPAHQFRV